jgi:hypothetical protein
LTHDTELRSRLEEVERAKSDEYDRLCARILAQSDEIARLKAALETKIGSKLDEIERRYLLEQRMASVLRALTQAAAAGDNGDGTVTVTMSAELVEQMKADLAAQPQSALLAKYGWTWRERPEVRCVELLASNGRVMAWIVERPGYCDRGHYGIGVECVPALDAQDAFPRYMMRLETAKQELVEFLAWRLFKERV